MKLHILSELHLECAPFALPRTDARVIVVAGDLTSGTDGVAWLKRLGKPVIYVAGVSEFDGTDHATALAELRRACAGSQVHFLENERAVVAGIRFLGCTLWTDHGRLHPGLLRDNLDRGSDTWFVDATTWWKVPENVQRLRDHGATEEWIERRRGCFHPLVAYDLHRSSMAWLTAELAQPFPGPTVVVTHHAPSYAALRAAGRPALVLDPDNWRPERYEALGLHMVSGHASDHDAWLRRQWPRIPLWIHGRFHTRLDYVAEGIRFVCNPRGRLDDRKITVSPAAAGEDPFLDSQALRELRGVRRAKHCMAGERLSFRPDCVVDTVEDLLPPILRAVRGSLNKHDRLIRNVNQMRPVLGNSDARAVDLAVAAIYSSVLDFDRTTVRLFTHLRKLIDPNWQRIEHDHIASLLERGHILAELPADLDRRLADQLARQLDLIPDRKPPEVDRLWLTSSGGIRPWKRQHKTEKNAAMSTPASWWGTEVAQRMETVRKILRDRLWNGVSCNLRGRRNMNHARSRAVGPESTPDLSRIRTRLAVAPHV